MVEGGFNPLIFFGTAVTGHILIAVWGTAEPHLSTVMRAWAEGILPTTNIYPIMGKKYIP